MIAPPGKTLNQGRILVVDDQINIVKLLCDFLSKNGYKAVGYTSANQAIKALKEQKFYLLLTDLNMPEMSGIELLKAALEVDPTLVGIVMTGHGNSKTAMEARKVGAFDYVLKPFKFPELLLTVSRAMEAHRLHESERKPRY
jgi:DNA-binding NtrC family response regulator